MNIAGWGLLTVVLITLLLVAAGAQDMQAQHAADFDAINHQRDELIRLADEARAQRDGANARAEMLNKQNGILVQERDAAIRREADRAAEVTRLQGEIAALQQERANLQARLNEQGNVIVEVPAPEEKVIPVVGGTNLEACLMAADQAVLDYAPYLLGLVMLVVLAGGALAAYAVRRG